MIPPLILYQDGSNTCSVFLKKRVVNDIAFDNVIDEDFIEFIPKELVSQRPERPYRYREEEEEDRRGKPKRPWQYREGEEEELVSQRPERPYRYREEEGREEEEGDAKRRVGEEGEEEEDEEEILKYKLKLRDGAYFFASGTEEIVRRTRDTKQFAIETWFNSRIKGSRIRQPFSFICSLTDMPTDPQIRGERPFYIPSSDFPFLPPSLRGRRGNEVEVDFDINNTLPNGDVIFNRTTIIGAREAENGGDNGEIGTNAYVWYFGDRASFINDSDYMNPTNAMLHKYDMNGLHYITLVVYYTINGDRKFNSITKVVRVYTAFGNLRMHGIELSINENGFLNASCNLDEENPYGTNIEITEHEIEKDTWYYTYLTIDESNYNLYLYDFNSHQLYKTSKDHELNEMSGSFGVKGNTIMMGENFAYSEGSFNGSIYRLRMWEKIVVKDENIMSYMSSSRNDNDILVNLEQIEGFGFVVEDTSGNGIDFRLRNREGNTNTDANNDLYPPEWSHQDLPF